MRGEVVSIREMEMRLKEVNKKRVNESHAFRE